MVSLALFLHSLFEEKASEPLKNVDLFSQNVTEKDESSTKYFQFSAWQIKTDCFFMPIEEVIYASNLV